ncbi:NDP-sugar synthase [Streptomyces sp. ME02-6979.5a]|uniref:NDP-sugar synthase n=1 Tax=Streptomyces sp. ME02-6979.5a TaxID=462925 RepID=UPI0029B5DDD2|nr:NDP-sugar synthase [Streptomyces sp. ME02-6979.5a]MDX3339698.1 NDP-sugar synthase [Streptomyces sp. ME02-6979.5a]
MGAVEDGPEPETVRGLVLAAGYGSRLAPVTDTCPKPLLPVLGVPLICWAVDRLRAVGITAVTVNVQAVHEPAFRQALASFADMGVEISYQREEVPLGTGGTLAALAGSWGGKTLLVLPADTISTLDLTALLANHRSGGGDVTLGCLRHPWPAAEFTGDVAGLAEDRRRVLRYQHKPGAAAKGRIAATGIAVFGPSAAGLVKDSVRLETFDTRAGRPDPMDLGRDVLAGIVARPDARVLAHITTHRFVDFGTPRQFLDGSFMVLAGRLGRPPFTDRPLAVVDPNASIHPEATISGPVYIGRGARVAQGSRVVGPAIIEEGSSVGPDAEVRECVLLPGARLAPRQRAFRMLISDAAATPVDGTSFHTNVAAP